jgi:integrase
MKLADWPEPDRQLWRAAQEPGDVFDDGGARAGMRSRTNEKVERGYGRWLTYLALHDPGCLAEAAAARITPERVRAYVLHLENLSNSTQTRLCRLQELGDMARVLDPTGDWSFIAKLAARVRARHVPARDKGDKMAGGEELLGLGFDLMAAAEHATTPRKAATLYRDGLLIALLIMLPLRRCNLAALVLDDTLVRRSGMWRITIPASETKTHDEEDALFPEVLVPHLERYLAVYRPYLCELTGRWHSPPGNALWLSADGSPMTEMAIYDRVRLQTSEHLGKPLGLHVFRDIAATTLAIEDPEHVLAAAPLLGHRSFNTTQKFYLRAWRLKAHRDYEEAIVERGVGRIGSQSATSRKRI